MSKAPTKRIGLWMIVVAAVSATAICAWIFVQLGGDFGPSATPIVDIDTDTGGSMLYSVDGVEIQGQNTTYKLPPAFFKQVTLIHLIQTDGQHGSWIVGSFSASLKDSPGVPKSSFAANLNGNKLSWTCTDSSGLHSITEDAKGTTVPECMRGLLGNEKIKGVKGGVQHTGNWVIITTSVP